MRALVILFGGRLHAAAFQDLLPGKNAFSLTLEKARLFPGAGKLVLLGKNGASYPGLPEDVALICRDEWTRKGFLETVSSLQADFDLIYIAWADCPFLDPALAGALADRHLRYAAEYSYADGWPYGFSPEILSPGVAGILAALEGERKGPVERDCLFSVIQKDINSFDIETEISPVDLRPHRLNLAADSRANFILLKRFFEAGLSGAGDAAELIAKKPELLRILPAFYSVQAAGPCPQSCSLCPYPQFGNSSGDISSRKDFLEPGKFAELLEKIISFSGEAVIDLSLWGEIALHPQKLDLIRHVLSRPALSLVIETSGIGWKNEDFEILAAEVRNAPERLNRMAPLSWIVSLDAQDPGRYKEIRGAGFAEALAAAEKLRELFPGDTYVQAVRVKGAEDDIELFYRHWKDATPHGANIIIQKYDHFAGALPPLGASDLSPVKRRPCWHLMRDMVILIDGTVPLCREDIFALKKQPQKEVLGNVFTDSLESIWSHGEAQYLEQCAGDYSGICAGCDEYYTYNF
ncbi:spiro-SPASM protein [Spirochaetia bacterium]|nr:spiro-SPASM protein [Spirochaetia bacterium]